MKYFISFHNIINDEKIADRLLFAKSAND